MLSSAAASSLAMFGLPGGVEWVVILIVALLLFGRRLPEIMRGLGGSVREFKKGLDTDHAPAANPPPADSVSREAAPKKTDDQPPAGT